MNQKSLQPAFVLHRRDYRDTSLIIELFTLHDGRVSVIAKGAKRTKSPLRNSLQMFQPILIARTGKNELQTLTQVEMQTPLMPIAGRYLAWAFYLNELLFRLLGKHDPYPELFHHYQNLLQSLVDNKADEKKLRLFEYTLLNELGYGLQLTTDNNEQALQDDAYYNFLPHQAPVKTSLTDNTHFIYPGSSLLAIQQQRFDDETVLQDAKRLLRHALLQLLGDKPLKSRELLI